MSLAAAHLAELHTMHWNVNESLGSLPECGRLKVVQTKIRTGFPVGAEIFICEPLLPGIFIQVMDGSFKLSTPKAIQGGAPS
jgi:hypothetical protein